MTGKPHEPLLALVQKPGRYTGGELGSAQKDPAAVALRYAFCFPDTYEIGMSHLGMKILYGLANAREDCWCERVFAPWIDMEALMRERGVPLWALESGDPVAAFDVIGFTLQYEMSYTNVLNMLDLAGLPLRAADRTGLTPLVIGGGPCACNPEPLAPFFDLFLPGEGEEVSGELLDLLKAHKAAGTDKRSFLRAAAQLPGVYVPALYDVTYQPDGTLAAVTSRDGAPPRVRKRVVADLDGSYFPDNFVVPFLETVHDRAVAELFRGCVRGCRFCQAGFLYRPIREKSAGTVNRQSRALCDATGYEELSLCSLSTSDYADLIPLLEGLLAWADPQRVNVSVPSLRADNVPPALLERLAKERRSGLTFAPEAGTQRLRDVINKNITEEQVLSTVCRAFAGGWTAVKLYFMIGLPTETEDDVRGIAALAQTVVDAFYHHPAKPKGKGVQVSVSTACFVPKPFTPFQWEPMDTKERLAEKQALLRGTVRSRKISLSCHHADISLLEGAFARGDRRLADVLEDAWRAGCRFDGWDDQLRLDLWEAAFAAREIDPCFYTARRRTFDELLPWDHMDYGISKRFLRREAEKAYAAAVTPSCRERCAGCGAERLSLCEAKAGSAGSSSG
ncbi:MAG: TIGR03960 family B12-binding radical SAM protein [Oscillospiraceae bacterium]|jgi:radical SAM family uncharacterized protein|nr:TIGR03960 family B12-binding radical SAM protein [Oscillospiraceae bacterium]